MGHGQQQAGERSARPRLYLVRHAKAEARERWPGPETCRPLTSRGRRQAEAIAEELAGARRPPCEIVSSPAVRCGETVEPLATRLELEVETVSWLYEGSDPAAALALLSERASRTVACTHGDVIWGLLELLSGDGVDLGPRPDAPKGGVWRIDYARRRDYAGRRPGHAGSAGGERVPAGDAATGQEEVRAVPRVIRAKLLLPGGGALHGAGNE